MNDIRIDTNCYKLIDFVLGLNANLFWPIVKENKKKITILILCVYNSQWANLFLKYCVGAYNKIVQEFIAEELCEQHSQELN